MRLLNAVEKVEEALLGWGLLALALLGFVQVVLRYAFGTGIDWAEEAGRYGCIALTFLGASVGVRHGTHFSVELLDRLLPPGGRRALRAVAGVLTAALFALVTWYGYEHAAKLHRFGVTSASLRLPMWVPYAAIPLFSATMALRFLADGLLWAARGRGLAPGREQG
ncbi:MAG: TRAP transporter small permease [Candidatus Dadabacteria bacterium]|nr:MAG: TRAP transporter small permease [Candidatus Dadabacteria bacterium]